MATSTQAVARTAFEQSGRKQRSLWGDAWRRLTRNKGAVVGGVIIMLVIVVAFIAPLLAPHNPVEQTANNSVRQPAWVDTGVPATTGQPEYLLGTDNLGRDILSKLLYGARTSMLVGLIPTVFAVLIGMVIGLLSGFRGGATDNVLMRFTDVVTSFPDLLFLITLQVALRDTTLGRAWNGLLLICITLSLLSWTGVARLVRGQVLSLKQKEFVEAARTVGVPVSRILFRHILPNALSPVIVATSFAIPGFILGEAVLTFLGVGVRPSVDPANPLPTSWGVMLNEGYSNLSSGPYMLLFPVICIATVMLAFTFIGDGLRDALDPRENQ
jgi:oligopeptide transport system permease protein